MPGTAIIIWQLINYQKVKTILLVKGNEEKKGNINTKFAEYIM